MLLRTHDTELDQLMRQNRQSQEKLSTAQLAECKSLQKKLKAEQVECCCCCYCYCCSAVLCSAAATTTTATRTTTTVTTSTFGF